MVVSFTTLPSKTANNIASSHSTTFLLKCIRSHSHFETVKCIQWWGYGVVNDNKDVKDAAKETDEVKNPNVQSRHSFLLLECAHERQLLRRCLEPAVTELGSRVDELEFDLLQVSS